MYHWEKMDLEVLSDNYTHNNDQLLDQIIFSVKFTGTFYIHVH